MFFGHFAYFLKEFEDGFMPLWLFAVGSFCVVLSFLAVSHLWATLVLWWARQQSPEDAKRAAQRRLRGEAAGIATETSGAESEQFMVDQSDSSDAGELNFEESVKLTPLGRELLTVCKSLSHLEDNALEWLSSNVKLLQVNTGDPVFEVDEPRNSFLVLRTGRLQVQMRGETQRAYEILPGETVVSLLVAILLSGNWHDSTVKASEPSELFCVPFVNVRELFCLHPEVMYGMLRLTLVRHVRVLHHVLLPWFGADVFAQDERRHAHMEQLEPNQCSANVHSTSLDPVGIVSDALGVRPSNRNSLSFTVTGDSEVYLDTHHWNIVEREAHIVVLKPGEHLTSREPSGKLFVLVSGDMMMHFSSDSSSDSFGTSSGFAPCVDSNAHADDFSAFPTSSSCHQSSPGRTINSGCGAAVGGWGSGHVAGNDPSVRRSAVRIPIGAVIGGVSVVSELAPPWFFSSRSECILVCLPAVAVKNLIRFDPYVAFSILRGWGRRLPAFLHRLDAALDWVHVPARHLLFRKGERCTSVYLVLGGRFRLLDQDFGNISSLRAEESQQSNVIARGQLVGDVASLSQGGLFRETAVALRDSECCKITSTFLHILSIVNPIGLMRFASARALTCRSTYDIAGGKCLRPPLSTIIVLGEKHDLTPVNQVCKRLVSSLRSILPATKHINREWLEGRFGVGIGSDSQETSFGSKLTSFRIGNALGQLEEQHQCVIYEADDSVTDWTKLVLRESDLVIFVFWYGAQTSTSPGPVESYVIQALRGRARMELLFLHPHRQISSSSGSKNKSTASREDENTFNFGPANFMRPHFLGGLRKTLSTRHYLRSRPHVDQWYHVRPFVEPDWDRVARRLSGTAVAVILGGGGAKGWAHIGVIKAMIELGIPIDVVGGVSFGALVSEK